MEKTVSNFEFQFKSLSDQNLAKDNSMMIGRKREKEKRKWSFHVRDDVAASQPTATTFSHSVFPFPFRLETEISKKMGFGNLEQLS